MPPPPLDRFSASLEKSKWVGETDYFPTPLVADDMKNNHFFLEPSP